MSKKLTTVQNNLTVFDLYSKIKGNQEKFNKSNHEEKL